MKNLKSKMAVMVLAGIWPVSSAWANSTPADQSGMLAMQVGIVHDNIQQVLAKLKNNPNQGPFQNADYLPRAAEFNAKVEKAMELYENTITNDILKPASVMVDQINAVQNSPLYSDVQKAALLKAQLMEANSFFRGLSGKYSTAIRQLQSIVLPKVSLQYVSCESKKIPAAEGMYIEKANQCVPGIDLHYRILAPSLHLDIPARLSLERADEHRYSTDSGYRDDYSFSCHSDIFNGSHFTDIFTANLLGANLEATYNNCALLAAQVNGLSAGGAASTDFYSGYDRNFRDPYFAKMIKQGCFSSSCITLYATQLASFLNLVDTTLNTPIQFQAKNVPADQQSLLRVDTFVNATNGLNYLTIGAADIEGLPFDISQSDYDKKMKGN